jgi:HNH endonuclease
MEDDAVKENHCSYCNRWVSEKMSHGSPRQKTRDHVVPRIVGGTETIVACASCNNAKGSLPARVFIAYIDIYGAPYRWLQMHKRDLAKFSNDCMIAGLHKVSNRHKNSAKNRQ